jgi:hypothetical protein
LSDAALATESYHESNSRRLKRKFPTAESYRAAVATASRETLATEFRRVNCFETSFVMPLYFWVGGTEAIFSLRRYSGERMVEVGFLTSDKPIVDALRDIFERYLYVNAHYSMVDKNDDSSLRFVWPSFEGRSARRRPSLPR